MNLATLEKALKSITNNDLKGESAHQLAYPKFRIELYSNTYPTEKTKRSAVMLLFYEKEGEVWLCLIKRPTYEGHHSGQVALPGGKYEKRDERLSATAVRETYEEVGISLSEDEIVTELSSVYIPISDFLVKPYISIARTTPSFKADRKEVAYVIEIKLSDLMSSTLEETAVRTLKGSSTAPSYLIGGETIWGGTAMILTELKQLVEERIR